MSNELNAALLVFLASFLISFVALIVLLHTGLAERVLDQPNARSLHAKPTPRVGGLAILAAVFVTDAALGESGVRFLFLIPLVAVSLLDDVRGLPIAPRFVIQIALAAGVVFSVLQPVGSAVVWTASVGLLAVIAVVWSTNLYNFMDGSDGLAGGMTVFGFSFLALGAFRGGETGLATYCLSFAAASLAFLCVNFHPARIFMGDSGSAPIGFAAAAVAVEGIAKGLWPLWYPVLVFAPFVLDATATLLRRMMRRERFWQAHRDHYYQRLIRMGWGHRRTALIYYGLMLSSGLAAFTALPMAMPVPLLVVLAVFVFAIGLMLAVDRSWTAAMRAGEARSS